MRLRRAFLTPTAPAPALAVPARVFTTHCAGARPHRDLTPSALARPRLRTGVPPARSRGLGSAGSPGDRPALRAPWAPRGSIPRPGGVPGPGSRRSRGRQGGGLPAPSSGPDGPRGALTTAAASCARGSLPPRRGRAAQARSAEGLPGSGPCPVLAASAPRTRSLRGALRARLRG